MARPSSPTKAVTANRHAPPSEEAEDMEVCSYDSGSNKYMEICADPLWIVSPHMVRPSSVTGNRHAPPSEEAEDMEVCSSDSGSNEYMEICTADPVQIVSPLMVQPSWPTKAVTANSHAPPSEEVKDRGLFDSLLGKKKEEEEKKQEEPQVKEEHEAGEKESHLYKLHRSSSSSSSSSNHPKHKHFHDGPPEILAEMKVMFEKAYVKGNTSAILGETSEAGHNVVEVDGSEDEVEAAAINMDATDDYGNKLKGTAKRRGASIAPSPKKHRKNPIAIDFKLMVGIMASGSTPTGPSIAEAMDIAIQAGVNEGSNEHFIATKLFVRQEYREMFATMKTDEAKINWLKRMYDSKMKEK